MCIKEYQKAVWHSNWKLFRVGSGGATAYLGGATTYLVGVGVVITRFKAKTQFKLD